MIRLFLALLCLATAVPAAAQQRGRDWTQVVSTTPQGGFRMGNPNAPVKVVEFLSLTCPHCAAFAADGAPPLIRNYVRTGRVSLEYRNFVLNGLDLAAAVISRCAAPNRYFALNHEIFATQQTWMGRIGAMTPQQRQAMQGLDPVETMRRVIAIAGLDAMAARHGVTPAQANRCVTQAAMDRVVEMQRSGSNFGVTGTPTFAINGQIAGTVHDWASLEPMLRGR